MAVGQSVLQFVFCNYLLFIITPAVVHGCWTVSSTVGVQCSVITCYSSLHLPVFMLILDHCSYVHGLAMLWLC